MTTEERFERIEQNLQAATETLNVLLGSQVKTQQGMEGLIQAHTMSQQKLDTLIESISKYVDDSRERTKRLEDNLDALIRAITAEHSNGKAKH